MIEIIDNFLPEEEFKSIQSLMMGGEFKWFYSEGRATDDDDFVFRFGRKRYGACEVFSVITDGIEEPSFIGSVNDITIYS